MTRLGLSLRCALTRLVAVTFLFWIAAVGLTLAQSPEIPNLEVHTGAGAVSFRVELADDSTKRALGLMFRHEMEPDAGMLFVFERDQMVSMWMKNTYIPLDMLFLAQDGTVVAIAERTVPLSMEVISSPRPVRAVLELNGGTSSRLGIQAGDRVEHPALN